MRILYFGSDRYASVKGLDHLHQRAQVTACVCDAAVAGHAIYDYCVEQGIPVYTRETLYPALAAEEVAPADIGVCYSYHHLIRKPAIDFLPGGIVNFHPSPLPEHRGVAGPCYAIMHGYTWWGASAHYVDEKFDTGRVIEVDKFDISGFTGTGIELDRIFQAHMYDLFLKITGRILRGEALTCAPQDQNQGHYYSHKDLERDKLVNPDEHDGRDIDALVRAMWFPPFHGAHILLGERKYSLVNDEILAELGALYGRALDEKYDKQTS